MKIKNNRVICECGTDLGEWEEGKLFFCKNCLKSGWGPKTYGVNVLMEDIIERERLKGRDENSFNNKDKKILRF